MQKKEFEVKSAPLFLFGAALLWSFCGVLTKSVDWNPLCLAALRGYISIVVAGLLLFFRKHKIQLTRTKIVVALCYFIQGALFMCANRYTTAANATALQNTSPLIIMLFNIWIAKKKPKKQELLVCAVLFFGIILAFSGNVHGGGMLGNMMALCSAFFYAGVYFFSREEGADALESLFLGNMCYLSLLFLFLKNDVVWSTTPSQWGFLLVFATLSGIGAWLCFAVGIRHTPSLQANFITLSEPVMAPIWTFLVLGERVSILSFAGCAIVIVTLLIYNTAQAKKHTTNQE